MNTLAPLKKPDAFSHHMSGIKMCKPCIPTKKGDMSCRSNTNGPYINEGAWDMSIAIVAIVYSSILDCSTSGCSMDVT